VTAGNENERPWIEGEPAFLLDEGTAYVRAWATAQRAASAIQGAMAELGQADAMPYLHADVNVFGNGVVELGRVTPHTAVLIADALRGLAAQRRSRPGDGCAA
jgi:hypothetical protein